MEVTGVFGNYIALVRVPHCNCTIEEAEETIQYIRVLTEESVERMRPLLSRRCDGCGDRLERTKRTTRKGTKRGSRCDGCKAAVYCGRACQVKHWSTHRVLCHRRQALYRSFDSALIPPERRMGQFIFAWTHASGLTEKWVLEVLNEYPGFKINPRV